MDEVVANEEGQVTDDIKEVLTPVFTSKEVYRAIKHMHPLKVLGSNGLPMLFYQKFQHIVDEDITEFMLWVLNHGGDVKDLNHTYICLILKVKKKKT